MKMRKEISLILFLNLVFLFTFSVNAQTNVSQGDQAQIFKQIFRQWKFRNSETVNDKREITIYLSDRHISAEMIPRIKGIKFIILAQTQIAEMKKNGVEYYSVSKFERKGKSLRIWFGVNYFNDAARNSWDSFTEFICRKISGKWKVSAGGVSASVSESF